MLTLLTVPGKWVQHAVMGKQDGAFLTIGELAEELGVPHHILRYWESRFPALRPLQRAGNRRYYRAEDVALARRIHQLLYVDGYTVKGAQLALSAKAGAGKSETDKADVHSVGIDVATTHAPAPASHVSVNDAAQAPASAHNAAEKEEIALRLSLVQQKLGNLLKKP